MCSCTTTTRPLPVAQWAATQDCSACWETGTDLAQFRELGQLSERREADADHAEDLQLLVLVCQTLHLAGLTVVQHQLHHLQVKGSAGEMVQHCETGMQHEILP